MRVTRYKVCLNDDDLNYLVKESSCNYNEDSICSPKSMCNFVNTLYNLNRMAEEHAYMIAFNKKMSVLGVFEVSHGSIDFAIMNASDIYKRALLCGASRIVVIHNHPSGTPKPSEEDKMVCKKLCTVGDIIGINMEDFMIVGKDSYYSMREKGELL